MAFKTRKEQKREAVRKFAIGAAITGLVGYIVGVLTAPKSGKETRSDMKDKAIESYNAAEKELKKLHTELSDVIDEVSGKVESLKSRKDVKSVVGKANDAKQKAREVLSALHDGDTDDKQLKKAIQDATDAIQNLKDFLKK